MNELLWIRLWQNLSWGETQSLQVALAPAVSLRRDP